MEPCTPSGLQQAKHGSASRSDQRHRDQGDGATATVARVVCASDEAFGQIEPGEERPIGLFFMLVRIWERIRRPGLANWCQQRAGHWDAAVAKSSALGATILSMALDETAAATATPTMTIYLDLAKFCDNVHLPTLMRTARLLDYPLRALALCGQMFLAPRVIRANGSFASAIQSETGMVPGSGQAHHLARALLYELLEKIHNVSLFFDGAPVCG